MVLRTCCAAAAAFLLATAGLYSGNRPQPARLEKAIRMTPFTWARPAPRRNYVFTRPRPTHLRSGAGRRDSPLVMLAYATLADCPVSDHPRDAVRPQSFSSLSACALRAPFAARRDAAHRTRMPMPIPSRPPTSRRTSLLPAPSIAGQQPVATWGKLQP